MFSYPKCICSTFQVLRSPIKYFWPGAAGLSQTVLLLSHRQSVTFRFQNFSVSKLFQFFEKCIGFGSEKFGIKKSIGFGTETIWYPKENWHWKKYQIRYWTYLVSNKSQILYKKIIKKSWIFFLRYSFINFCIGLVSVSIHSKNVKICGFCFLVSKNLQKKYVNRNNKISRQKCVN